MEGEKVSTEDTTKVAVDAVYNMDNETLNQNTDDAANEQTEHVISSKSNNEEGLAGANHSSDKLVENVYVDSKTRMAIETLKRISLSVLNKQIEHVSISSQSDIKKVLVNSDNSFNKENEDDAVDAVFIMDNETLNQNTDDAANEKIEHVISSKSNNEEGLAGANHSSDKLIENVYVDSKTKMAIETLKQISLSVLNKQIEHVSISSQSDIKKVLTNSDNSFNKENEDDAVDAVDNMDNETLNQTDNAVNEQIKHVAAGLEYKIDYVSLNQNSEDALNKQIDNVISSKSNNEEGLAGANHSSDKLVENVSVDSKNKMAIETLKRISLSVLNKQIEHVSISSQSDIKKVLTNSDNSFNKENEDVAVDPENNIEIKYNDDALNKQNEHVVINLKNGDEKLLANSDNSSNKQIEHMKSLQVLVERIKYYDCKKCYSVFLHPHKLTLHSVKHINPKRKFTEDVDDRFVKRFKCEECDAKFVQLSTLEEHALLHQPRPHACHCGVDFFLKKDLAAHKNLVHSAQIDQEIAHLTLRQKRAIKNEIWLPHINYTGPKIKEDFKSEEDDDDEEEEEPIRGVRPRLKAQLIKKQKRKPRTTANHPKIKRIESKIKNLDIKPNSDKTYSCPHCPKVFKAKRNVEVHQVVHTGEKPYSCHLCEKKYTQPSNLNSHLKMHMGIKEFCCVVCNKQFIRLAAFQLHMRTHTGEKPYSCTFCKKAFSDPSAFKRHTRTHTGVKPYACMYCEMRFSDASGLIAHRRIHEGNKQHQCKHCSKWFYTNDAMRKHIICVHENSTKNYECKICSKSFVLPGYLYLHNKNAHRDNKETYECDHCDYKSAVKNNLRCHIERKHMNMEFLCKECGRSFNHRNYLRVHQEYTHGVKRLQKYECDECAKIFNRKSDIYRHILSKHPSVKCGKCSRAFANSVDLKQHNCVQCNKCCHYFKKQTDLVYHIERFHVLEKKYRCQFCIKKFLSKCDLVVHYRRVHKRDTPNKLECNDCGQRFPDKSKLRHHIFSLHLIYLYCHICNKRFHSTTELQQHKMKTNGDCKPTCEICNQPVSKKYMRQHLLIHMADKKYSCAHCISSYSDRYALQRHLKLSHKYLFLVKKKKKLCR